jgi:hypothetical protein
MVNMYIGQPLLEYAKSEDAQGELCREVLGKPTVTELQDMGLPITQEEMQESGPNVEVRLKRVLCEVLLNRLVDGSQGVRAPS